MAPTDSATTPAGPDGLDHYVMTDQPTDCPKCQRRTPFTDLPDGNEHHTCGHCGYEFVMCPDFDGEEQCEHCRDFAPVEDLEAADGLCPTCVSRGVRKVDDEYVDPDDLDPDDEG